MKGILTAKRKDPYVSTIVEVIIGKQMTEEQKREWRTHTEEVKGYDSWESGFSYVYYPGMAQQFVGKCAKEGGSED